jgi:alcohol dehydrogenase (cytochrome c)
MQNGRRWTLIVLGTVVAVGFAGVFGIPQLRWRAEVILLHLAGEIPDITLAETIQFMLPGSDQSMAFLIEKRNPYAVVQNMRTSDQDVQAGGLLYQAHCISCHGTDAVGSQVAPALVGRPYKHGDSDWAVYRAIRLGVPNSAMQPSAPLSPTERWQLISYIRSLDKPVDASLVIETAPPATYRTVLFDDIVAAEQQPQEWLTFSGSYSSSRHSRLEQINRDNVAQLGLKWIRQFQGTNEFVEVSPLVHDGIMYLSLPACDLHALDAASGKSLWMFRCSLLKDTPGEFSWTNTRGVALLGDKIFMATWDARLFAIDAKTGREVWRTTVDADAETYDISSAPLALNGQVIVGVATRWVGRGYIAAFDAATGEERWRFHSIPAAGEPGNETWEDDSWKAGGGSMWLSGSYDPETDLVYWPVGNPKPDYDSHLRRGDNLYTNSIVALRASTGELVWHFQATPADDKDWDGSQMPVLADLRKQDGDVEKVLLWANRNGFVYVLDRVTGKFLRGAPFVHQNWADGLDSNGRPILKPLSGRLEGDLIYPGNVGGTNWWPPTYDPQRQLLIVPALEQGMVFFSSFNSPPRVTGSPFYTAVRAIDPLTAKVVWEHRHEPRHTDNATAGLVSTDGGLVFGGDRSEFFAYDIDSGDVLWSVDLGGTIMAAPVTFSTAGAQMVAIAAGGDVLAFGLPVRASPSGNSQSSAIE